MKHFYAGAIGALLVTTIYALGTNGHEQWAWGIVFALCGFAVGVAGVGAWELKKP